MSEVCNRGVRLALLMFEKEESKSECVRVYKSHGRCKGSRADCLSCCKSQLPEEYLFQGVALRISTDIPAPDDINHRNVDYSNLKRAIKLVLVLFVFAALVALAELFMEIALTAQRFACDRVYSATEAAVAAEGSTPQVCYCASLPIFANMAQEPCLSEASNVIYGYGRMLIMAAIATAFHYAFLWLGRLSAWWMCFELRSTGLTFSALVAGWFSLLVSAVAPVLISAEIEGYRPVSGVLFLIRWFSL